jgi:hypothetical protein
VYDLFHYARLRVKLRFQVEPLPIPHDSRPFNAV